MSPKPLPYQIEGVKAIRNFNGRALLADEMGLGKTLQSLWYAARSKKRPIVIVCPASLKANWKHEASLVGFAATVINGRRGYREGLVKNLDSVLIINYDILHTWVDTLRRLKPQLVIMDECQYVTNRKTQRARAAMKLCKGVESVLCLSGTPLTNRPAELWVVLNILWPQLFPHFKTFAARYCRPRMTPWGWDYSGSQNLRELHNKLKACGMIRRLKVDVLKELPAKSQRVVLVPMTNPQEYELAATNFLRWLRNQDPTKVRAARRRRAVVQLTALKLVAARLKRKAMVEHFDRVLQETDEKIVISCVHTKMIESLAAYYGDRAVVLHGKTPLSQRHINVQRFQTDDRVRVFIGQLQAAGTGITLTASSKVFFAELGARPGDHAQMADRVHRIGQHHPCEAIYMVAENTVEHRLCEIIQTKQGVVSRVLDGTLDIGDMDIHDQLIAELVDERS
jgi:SWI/SNF-related matrix-associated actin-dependent regulator 1 of chromatin subfamily A